jgi:hypothetical protein
MGYHRFIVAQVGGMARNEYRIVDGQVQVRLADPKGGAAQRWRLLSQRDVHVHLSLGTDVGKWLARHMRHLPPL